MDERVAEALAQDYALGTHAASFGLGFSNSTHQVIFVPYQAGNPSGEPIEVLTIVGSNGGDAYGGEPLA